jgi:hypothetical protein
MSGGEGESWTVYYWIGRVEDRLFKDETDSTFTKTPSELRGRIASAESPQVYILASPPTSQVGLVLRGKYYTFGREPPEVKCDLRYEGACYWKSDAKVKQLTKDIMSINDGKAFGCSRSIIPDMSKVPGYESGYGECTAKGWIPMRSD